MKQGNEKKYNRVRTLNFLEMNWDGTQLSFFWNVSYKPNKCVPR